MKPLEKIQKNLSKTSAPLRKNLIKIYEVGPSKAKEPPRKFWNEDICGAN